MSSQHTEDKDQNVFKENAVQSTKSEQKNEASGKGASTGMDKNVAGMLCYLVGFITGIIFLVIEKEDRFVRYHALQSIITFGIIFIASIVLTAIPIIGWLIGILISPLSVIIWIILMIKAYQGKWFKLPIAGKMAEKQLNSMEK
ncbi:DUF4870 domain-containing protein [Virgibacillus sp. W0430]|uniref:DUF4870 domain-containing protein n=1 Tax=Virgibacillus sp. W0430 TaxID=3391580 RepID=UPI003F489C7B